MIKSIIKKTTSNQETIKAIVTRNDFPSIVKSLGVLNLKEDTSTNSFKQFFSFFPTLVNKKELTLEEKNKIEIEKEVDVLMEKEDLNSIAELMKNGFEFNNQQKVKFTKTYWDKTKKDHDDTLSILSNLIEQGFNLPEQFIEKYYFHFSFQIYCADHLKIKQDKEMLSHEDFIKKYRYEYEQERANESKLNKRFKIIIKPISQYLENIDNKINILNIALNNAKKYPHLENGHFIDDSIVNILLYNEFLLKELNALKKKEVVIILKNLSKEMLKDIKGREHLEGVKNIIDLLENGYVHNEESLQKLIEKTKTSYGKQFQREEIVLKTIIENKTLPDNVKEKIENIEEAYQFILKNKSSININKFAETENIITKRLPQFLDDFTSLRVKTDVKLADTENPQKILEDILDEMNVFLEGVSEEINNKKLTNLSVGRNYIKNYTKENTNDKKNKL